MLIQYSIFECLRWVTKSVMTSGLGKSRFLFSLYFLNGKNGKCINRLAPDVRASLLITSLWLCYSRSRCVCVCVCVCVSLTLHPSLQAQPFLLDSFSFRHRHHSLFRQKGNRHVAMDLWRHYRRLWDPTQPDGGQKEKEKEFHSNGKSVRNPDENTSTSNTDKSLVQFPTVPAVFSVLLLLIYAL